MVVTILIMGTPKKGTLNFGKLPYVPKPLNRKGLGPRMVLQTLLRLKVWVLRPVRGVSRDPYGYM